MLFCCCFLLCVEQCAATSAQQKPVALLFVHPAFVVLIKAFDLIQNKCEATNAKRKTIVMLFCCCFLLCVNSAQPHQRNKIRLHCCLCILILLRTEQACSSYLKQKFRAARNHQQYFSVAFRGLGNAPFKTSAKHHRKAAKQ